ncbi:MAG: hypothetical protein HYX65_07820 [Gemmatimonadetes bacterium]|nr:hypothetical protein [Gemmatimonadota bacterium]
MADDRNLPAQQPIDRPALERVLARAAELQNRVADAPELMTEAELIALGNEVGLGAEALRQALAEERTRGLAPVDTGMASRVLGSATVSATRIVKGTPDGVLARLDEWMRHEETLAVQRKSPTRIAWEARSDLVGTVQRSFNLGGRGYALSRASEVAATVSGLDGDRVHVRLDANLVGLRTSRLRSGVVAGAVCVMGTGVLLALNFMLPVALIGVAVSPVAFWQTARSFRPAVDRALVMLEHYLDRLEHGEDKRPPSLLDLLSSGRPPR